MKKLILTCLLMPVALGVLSCATLSVQTDYDRTIDFARYRFFSWTEPQDKQAPPPEWVDNIVRGAVEQELSGKGYRKADGNEADFLLAYRAALEERTVWQPVTVGAGVECVRRYTFVQGTLLIDVIDPKLDRAVWRGCAAEVVGDRSKAPGKIPAAVKAILQKFPPQQSGGPRADR